MSDSCTFAAMQICDVCPSCRNREKTKSVIKCCVIYITLHRLLKNTFVSRLNLANVRAAYHPTTHPSGGSILKRK